MDGVPRPLPLLVTGASDNGVPGRLPPLLFALPLPLGVDEGIGGADAVKGGSFGNVLEDRFNLTRVTTGPLEEDDGGEGEDDEDDGGGVDDDDGGGGGANNGIGVRRALLGDGGTANCDAGTALLVLLFMEVIPHTLKRGPVIIPIQTFLLLTNESKSNNIELLTFTCHGHTHTDIKALTSILHWK